MNILCFDTKHKLNLDNAWLSGFTDAKGCFTSELISKIDKNVVTVKYIIPKIDDLEFSKI